MSDYAHSVMQELTVDCDFNENQEVMRSTMESNIIKRMQAVTELMTVEAQRLNTKYKTRNLSGAVKSVKYKQLQSEYDQLVARLRELK